MKQLDEILMMLQDSTWNDCSEIKEGLAVSGNQFHEATLFLQKQQLLELDNSGIKITSQGKKFLELPH